MDSELQNSFVRALEQNQHKLLRVCSVYAVDPDDKKDLFQEALVNIWEAMPSFDGKSSMSTWMFRITLNVCLRLHSRLAKRRSRFLSMDSAAIEGIEEDETGSVDHEKLIKMRSCIRQLNEGDRAIIALYLEELPYREISDITGMKENHVAVTVKRIKKKLLNCITKRL